MRITDFNHLSRVSRDPFGSIKSVAINSTGDEVEDALLLTRHIAYKIIAPIIVSTGLLGNILTIIILRNPMFKGVMYNFFLSLAVFDFLSLIFSVSAIMHLLHPVTPSYVIAVWYSYLEIMFVNGLMGTSVLIVVCITFDRYMSACHPFTFKTLHTNKFCKIGIFCSWFVAFLVWMPTCFLKTPTHINDCSSFYFSDEYVNQSAWVACQFTDPHIHEWYNVYAWIREIVICFLPIIAIIILNGLLVKYFVENHKTNPISTSALPTSSSKASSNRQTADNNLKSLLKAIIISFLITILPAGIFNASFSEKLTTNLKYEIFRATANNLELLNHALNFYLYILLSKPVRSALPSMANKIKLNIISKLDLILRKGSITAKNLNSEPSTNQAIERNCPLHSENRETKGIARQTQFSDLPSDVISEAVNDDTSKESTPELSRTHAVPIDIMTIERNSLISNKESKQISKTIDISR